MPPLQPKYNLTYFNLKGRGEPIRLILAYAKAPYEDTRLGVQDWPTKKSDTPFGKLPMLEVDGKVLHQSVAICRFLGRKYGLGGKNQWENLKIDEIVDVMRDIAKEISDFMHETNKKVKAEKRGPLMSETLPYYLSKFNDEVKKNGGYFVSNRLTWADLYWVGCLEYLGVACGLKRAVELVESHHYLKEHFQTVTNIPTIKQWMENRPATPM